MKKTFTLTRAEFEAADAVSLKAQIVSEVGSESEAASILRSLDRLGTDPTIDYYEMIQVKGRAMYGGATSVSWRVRADRGEPTEPTL